MSDSEHFWEKSRKKNFWSKNHKFQNILALVKILAFALGPGGADHELPLLKKREVPGRSVNLKKKTSAKKFWNLEREEGKKERNGAGPQI